MILSFEQTYDLVCGVVMWLPQAWLGTPPRLCLGLLRNHSSPEEAMHTGLETYKGKSLQDTKAGYSS